MFRRIYIYVHTYLSSLDESRESPDTLRPVQRVNVVFHTKHGGCVDGAALKQRFIDYTLVLHTEDLWHRSILGVEGGQTLNSSWTKKPCQFEKFVKCVDDFSSLNTFLKSFTIKKKRNRLDSSPHNEHSVGTFATHNLLPRIGSNVHFAPIDVHREHSTIDIHVWG
jgi:hypothetical protein